MDNFNRTDFIICKTNFSEFVTNFGCDCFNHLVFLLLNIWCMIFLLRKISFIKFSNPPLFPISDPENFVNFKILCTFYTSFVFDQQLNQYPNLIFHSLFSDFHVKCDFCIECSSHSLPDLLDMSRVMSNFMGKII